MKNPSQKAFIIALTLYGLISLVGYWLYTLPPAKENPVKLTTVPITLAMFQAPPIVTPTPSTQTKEPIIVEPKIQPTIKPKTESKPVQTARPVEPKKSPPPPKEELPKELPKEQPKEHPKKTPVTQHTPTPQTHREAEPVTTTAPPPKMETPSAVAKNPQPQQPQRNPLNTEEAEQLYLSELNTQIARHAKNSYPKRAKRRRWEGDVLIQFTLFPSGAIKYINIIQSSGRSMLDEAAFHILKTQMNSQFKPFPDDIMRNKWVIKVPVSYHLEY